MYCIPGKAHKEENRLVELIEELAATLYCVVNGRELLTDSYEKQTFSEREYKMSQCSYVYVDVHIC